MGDFIAGCLAIGCGLLALMFLAMLCQDLGHQKEKKAKLELMQRHPEHAAQIQEAIDHQEVQYQTQRQQVVSAFQPAPKKKSGGAAGKLVVVALCVIYIISPIDFIPDVIPVLGWGDDLAAGLIGLKALMK